MMEQKAGEKMYLLFDLDGTLTDPGLGITNSVLYALEKFGIVPASREELYPYIGPPLIDSFQKYHGLTSKQAEEALGYYREYFSVRGLYENEPYPGIEALLRTLQRAGYTLIVATSKPEEFTHTILQHFRLDTYFSFVGGNTLDESRPTKAAVIRYIQEHFPDLTGENALMIGDRCYDMEGARACGLPAVGVLYGYGSRSELESAGADTVAQTPEELAEIIFRRLSL